MAEYVEDLGDEILDIFFEMPDEALLDAEFHDLLEETTREVRNDNVPLHFMSFYWTNDEYIQISSQDTKENWYILAWRPTRYFFW